MKLNKIIAAVVSGALAVSALAFSVSAADPIEMKLYAQETTAWELLESSDSVSVTGDGSYSISLDAKGNDLYATLYLKDVKASKATDEMKAAKLIVDSIMINDSIALDMSKTEFDFVGDTGVADICFVNQWAETFVNNAVKNGDSYNYTDASGNVVAADKITLNFTISGLGGGAPAAAADTTAAPAADTTTASAATGNTTTAVILSVMAVAGAAAIVAKKRK